MITTACALTAFGARRADYEQEYGRLDLIPLSDLHGTAIIVKPWNERKAGEAQ